ncbi:plasmid fertility inhibition factor family protein [Pseudovibrio ascidiaceicola]|uniref:plasmid fertility inhibition factor family protein n=1 Tax=Pseudovibrio ascidiaceicola TaxID=285279 RepID=UPI003D364818
MFETEVRKELQHLNAHPEPVSTAEIPEVVSKNTSMIVWSINAPDRPRVFMAAYSHHDMKSDFLVMVNGEAFYRVWLHSRLLNGPATHCVVRSKMFADRKFGYADTALASSSAEYPVPVVECGIFNEGDHTGICHSDTVTRCMWLIANRTPAFPVKIRGRHETEILNRKVGLGLAIKSLHELFNEENIYFSSDLQQSI